MADDVLDPTGSINSQLAIYSEEDSEELQTAPLLVSSRLNEIDVEAIKVILKKILTVSWRLGGPMIEALVDSLALADLIITIMEGYPLRLAQTIRICLLAEAPAIALISAINKILQQNKVTRFHLDTAGELWSAAIHGGTSFTSFLVSFAFFIVTEAVRLYQHDPDEEVEISNEAAWGIILGCLGAGYLEFLRRLYLNTQNNNEDVDLNQSVVERTQLQKYLANVGKVSYWTLAPVLVALGGASTYHSVYETMKMVLSLEVTGLADLIFDWGGFITVGLASSVILSPISTQDRWYTKLFSGGLDVTKVVDMVMLYTFLLTRPNAKDEMGEEAYWVQGTLWPALFTLVLLINLGIVYGSDIKQGILGWFNDEESLGNGNGDSDDSTISDEEEGYFSGVHYGSIGDSSKSIVDKNVIAFRKPEPVDQQAFGESRLLLLNNSGSAKANKLERTGNSCCDFINGDCIPTIFNRGKK